MAKQTKRNGKRTRARRRTASSCTRWTLEEVVSALLLRLDCGLEGNAALALAFNRLKLGGGSRSAEAVAYVPNALGAHETLAGLAKCGKGSAGELLGLTRDAELPVRSARHPAILRAVRELDGALLSALAAEEERGTAARPGSAVAAEEIRRREAVPRVKTLAPAPAVQVLPVLDALRRLPGFEGAEVRAAGVRVSVSADGSFRLLDS